MEFVVLLCIELNLCQVSCIFLFFVVCLLDVFSTCNDERNKNENSKFIHGFLDQLKECDLSLHEKVEVWDRYRLYELSLYLDKKDSLTLFFNKKLQEARK